MNDTELRKRVCKRLYGDAWRDNWKEAPSSLEIAEYKDAWKADVDPLYIPIVDSPYKILAFHKWFNDTGISRLDYDVINLKRSPAFDHTTDVKVYVKEEDVRALFRLTFG